MDPTARSRISRRLAERAIDAATRILHVNDWAAAHLESNEFEQALVALARWELPKLSKDPTALLLSARAKLGLAQWDAAGEDADAAFKIGPLEPIARLEANRIREQARRLGNLESLLAWDIGQVIDWESDQPRTWTLPTTLDPLVAFQVSFRFRVNALDFDTPVVFGAAWGSAAQPWSKRPLVALQIHERSGPRGTNVVQLGLEVGAGGRESAVESALDLELPGIRSDLPLVARIVHVPEMGASWASLEVAGSAEPIASLRLFDARHGGATEQVEVGLLGTKIRGENAGSARVVLEALELKVAPKR